MITTLAITHTDRELDVDRCSLSHFRSRFECPDRLSSVPPLAALPPAENFDVYAGGVTIWSLDFARSPTARLLRHISPSWRIQHATVIQTGLALLGTTRLELHADGGAVEVISDPWMAGAHTVAERADGLLYVSCSAPDAVLVVDPKQRRVVEAWRLPEQQFGVNYRLTRHDDIRLNYIGNDLQLAHLNRASPDGDAVLVSTLIQGAIGHLSRGGVWREITRGYIGCHGIRRHARHGLYFADSCAGRAVFLDSYGRSVRHVDFNCQWLHDVEIINENILLGAVADRNLVAFFDLSRGRWLGALDCRDFGRGVQFLGASLRSTTKWLEASAPEFSQPVVPTSVSLADHTYKLFLDLSRLDLGKSLFSIDIAGFEAAEATLALRSDHLRISTTENRSLYAALSQEFPAICEEGLGLLVDMEVVIGACSVGLLYLPRNKMILSRAVRGVGRQRLVFPISPVENVGIMRIVISNFSEESPRQSVILLHSASVIRFPLPLLRDGRIPQS